jgi:hypothetical protein
MAAARIAAIALFVLTSGIHAQEVAQGRILIKVTDFMGSSFNDAQIWITKPPSSVAHFWAITDHMGRANLDLAIGAYVLSIEHAGFKTSTRDLKVIGSTGQTVEIALEMDPTPMCGPCIDTGPEIPVEHPTPIDSFPFEPLTLLAPLPSHKLHHPRVADVKPSTKD